MPVTDCRVGGKPGYKWGQSGHCYQYKAGDSASRMRARKKVLTQAAAIKADQAKKGKEVNVTTSGDVQVDNPQVMGKKVRKRKYPKKVKVK